VLEITGGKIVELTFFLATDTLFPLFGVPSGPVDDAALDAFALS
jgi:hypothetical protein